MIPTESKIIAIDFDGTIVDDAFPSIGKPKIFAFDTLKRLQNDGFRLVLWTYRSGAKLNEAVEFCRENGVEFYAVNASYPEEKFNPDTQSRKIHADLFIDDRIVGGFPSWGEIYQKIKGIDEIPEFAREKKKKGLFQFLYDSLQNSRRN